MTLISEEQIKKRVPPPSDLRGGYFSASKSVRTLCVLTRHKVSHRLSSSLSFLGVGVTISRSCRFELLLLVM